MLSFSQVSKQFSRGSKPALNDVSFSVEEGGICGLLGHNGAGKSTALGIILGMVYPDSGSVEIDGVSVLTQREKALRKVGAIFEAPAFYEYLSGWHNLKALTSFSAGLKRDEILEIVDWVGLSDRIGDRVGTYSHGMRQRLALAQALLPRPKILVLDEPTDGLDPEGIIEFREQILRLRDDLGITVLLSSHLLSEVEQLCDSVVIVQAGEKKYEGAVRFSEEGVALYQIAFEANEKAAEIIESLGGAKTGSRYCFPSDRSEADILSALVRAEVRVTRFGREEPSLEEFYLSMSRKESEGGGS